MLVHQYFAQGASLLNYSLSKCGKLLYAAIVGQLLDLNTALSS